MDKLFEYFIHYQCCIKISVIFSSISNICIDITFYNIYPLGHEIIISNKNQVISFLNNISFSKDFWPFSDDSYNTIKIASKFLLSCFFEGTGHKIFQLNAQSIFLLICSAGSDLWSGLLCSYHLVTVLYRFSYVIISTMFTFSIIYRTRWIQIFIFDFK